MITKEEFKTLTTRIEKMKAKGTFDLSTDEDLCLAVMNLVSLEEHFFFTGAKTEKPEYFDLLDRIREIRKKLLGKLVGQHEGETWCASKHLLASTMRSIEVGTKLQASGKKEEAREMFDHAHELYSIFWGLRLQLISLPQVKKAAASEKPWTLKDIVDNLVDCCDE
jgi:hypothetical protein